MFDFLVAVGLVFIFEGMILFISPKRLKNILNIINDYSEKKIRLIGLFYYYRINYSKYNPIVN